MSFPKDFLWGSASAAYQIEGAYNKDGKGLSNWDEFVKIEGKTYKNTNGNEAVDFYHHYKEDIKLMHEMGLKCYRFSIAWTRIIPDGNGEINELGLKFYEQVIDECLKYGIEPMVTIFHWDLPLHLQVTYNGFESKQIIDDFVNYAKVLFNRFKGKVKYWVTINEQNVFTSLGWLMGMHPPGIVNDYKKYYQVNHHVFMAHAKTVIELKKIIPDALVGASFAYNPGYAKDCDPKNVISNEYYNELMNYWWMDMYAKGEYPIIISSYLKKMGAYPEIEENDFKILSEASKLVDFMGINYYQTCVNMYNPLDGYTMQAKYNFDGKKGSSVIKGIPGLYANPKNPFLKTTDWDWIIDPQGIRIAIYIITSRYKLPVVISENGLGAFDKLEDNKVHDTYRIDYIKQHLIEIKQAIDDGCKVLAYCTWSFTDLLSWLNGYQKRYGFVYVDKEDEETKTLKRIKKDSYYWYKEIIKNNGSDL